MRKAMWSLLSVLGVALVLACGGVSDTDGTKVDSGKPTEAEETAYQPSPKDFKLTVKVLKQECFGSAGCNVIYRIKVAYVGTEALNSDVTYEVTYEVSGGEDGPAINTFTITGDTYEVDKEEIASTSSSSKKLTAKPTEVSPV